VGNQGARRRCGADEIGRLPSRLLQGRVALLFALAFLFVTGASSAIAGTGDEASQVEPTQQDYLEAAEEGGSEPAVPTIDSEAAEDLPHSDLDRAEATELVTAVFGDVLEGASGIFGEIDVEGYRSDHVAVVSADRQVTSPEASDRALLTSILPLRIEGSEGVKEPVDLKLETVAGELQPANPLVDVKVPDELHEGISLPETGVEVHLAGVAPDRSPSLATESVALYPNVAEETDLTVAPTPTGFETQTVLRAADAPRRQVFRISMPTGASLKASESGGAEVVRGSDLLMRVAPPTAIDAQGNPVAVTLAVEGDTIIVDVTPSEDASYPILVDPYYESGFYWWLNNSTEGTDEWIPASQSADRYGTPVRGFFNEPGLHIYSYDGPITPGSQANWNYHVPRYFSDYQSFGVRPTTYIQQMKLSELHWWIEESQPYKEHPFVLLGIWDENAGWWNTFSTRNGVQGEMHPPYTFEMNNTPQPGGGPTTGVKFGGVSMSTFENVSRRRHLLVGQASVQISDLDSPAFEQVLNPTKWVNEVPLPIGYTAKDPGLGIYAAYVRAANPGGGPFTWGGPLGCFGNVKVPCPRVKSAETSTYDPKVMQQGENYVELLAADPIWHWSEPANAKLKVDHTKPSLSLSGTMTEQATTGTTAAQYKLAYTAADGDSAAPVAQAPFGGAGSEAGKTQYPNGIVTDTSGNVYVADRDNHRVEKFDSTGKFLMQFGSNGTGNGQFKGPRGIAISPCTGNLFVVDSGNGRVQQFKPNGTYVTKFGEKEGGGSYFVNLADIAVTPKASDAEPCTIYLTDQGGNRVAGFLENGTFVGNITGSVNSPITFNEPRGIAVDANRNIYVGDQSNRVQEIGPDGKLIRQFGSGGSGSGQFTGPTDVAIGPSGNVLVVDGANARIVAFRSTGQFVRNFAGPGTGSAGLWAPKGIAIGANNTAYIADGENHRVARWSHGDYDPQAGAASTEVRIDGALVEPKHAPGCASKDCVISREWTLNADQYPVGAHTVTVTATDAVGLATSKSVAIETHGDLLAPDVALSGTMTEQATLGKTRPTYTLKMAATDPGGALERKSGVASTVIKVDGVSVDSAAPGCPAGGCSIIREWTLDAMAYSPGAHLVQATATDAAGRSATKSFTITIARDTTAPALTATQTFFTAPEGWLEQVSYSYAPSASDPNGYGITSMTLKIDGAAVKSASQTCPKGGCSLSLSGTINMAAYVGGAHPAELVASDGAGNVQKKNWTININPSGAVPGSEAADTAEALEASVGEAPVAPTDEELSQAQRDGGDDPSLVKIGGEIASEGVPDTTTLPGGSAAKVEVEGPQYSLTITQLAVPPQDPSIITEDIAAVSANLAKETDFLIRPQYNGMMQFGQIRDVTSPESFSWEMQMEPAQSLALIDAQHAEVRYEDGVRAFLITAETAHDATGAAVSTSLSTSGKVLTLTVHHREKPFVYPVIAGQAFETSYEPGSIPMPPTEAELKEAEWEDEGTPFSNPYPPLVGKSLSVGEIRYALRKPRRSGLIAAPDVASASKLRYFKIDRETCHPQTCDAWQVHMSGAKFARHTESVEWTDGASIHCEGDIDFPFYLSTSIDIYNSGFVGPWGAKKGSGRHLAVWCHYILDVWAVAEDYSKIPFIPSPTKERTMQVWVYPNGYQQEHTYAWSGPPIEIHED
jgi:hypothetical protein